LQNIYILSKVPVPLENKVIDFFMKLLLSEPEGAIITNALIIASKLCKS